MRHLRQSAVQLTRTYRFDMRQRHIATRGRSVRPSQATAARSLPGVRLSGAFKAGGLSTFERR